MAGGRLSFRDAATGQRLAVHVARPVYAAHAPGLIGPWIWLSDDGRDAAMINMDAFGNVTVQAVPGSIARRLLGKP